MFGIDSASLIVKQEYIVIEPNMPMRQLRQLMLKGEVMLPSVQVITL